MDLNVLRLVQHLQKPALNDEGHSVADATISYALDEYGPSYLAGMHDQVHGRVGATKEFLAQQTTIPLLGSPTVNGNGVRG